MHIEVSAPSNIALVKYMGKHNTNNNIPANPSLSWTTPALRSFVRLELIKTGRKARAETSVADCWKPHPDYPLELSSFGENKFLLFFTKLKQQMGLKDHSFIVYSGNNFPSDCGIASSASSFAALTLATYEAALQLDTTTQRTAFELSQLSRLGSGSSCRSFHDNWVRWVNDGGEHMPVRHTDIMHNVLVVEGGKKSVSSSEAHKKVAHSALFSGRIERATKRFDRVCALLSAEDLDWQQLYEVCWSEFWDMHALFETCEPSFGYMTGDSLSALNCIRSFWHNNGDGPVVTMDAGANIHCLWREEQKQSREELLRLVQPYTTHILG